MSSKLRIFPARRREASVKGTRGRTVTLKMKFNDFEIITRSRSVPLGGRDPTSLEEPEPTVPPIRKIETDEFGMPTDKVLRVCLSVNS